MFTRIKHLQWKGLQVFLAFAEAVETNNDISGVEQAPWPYGNKEPYSGDRQEVIVWQGRADNYHQRLHVTFCYHEDYGWYPERLEFAGRMCRAPQPEDVWSKKFRVYQRQLPNKEYVFIPETYTNDEWLDMTPSEQKEALRWFLRINGGIRLRMKEVANGFYPADVLIVHPYNQTFDVDLWGEGKRLNGIKYDDMQSPEPGKTVTIWVHAGEAKLS